MRLTLFELYFAVASAMVVVLITYMSIVSLQKAVKEEKRIVTVARCPRCGYTVKREFKDGDFVGKVLDEKCPRCNENLVVDAIYEETAEGLKKAASRRS